MIAIGDILSVVAVLGGVWLTAAAALAVLVLLAPRLVGRARGRIESERAGGVGLGVLWLVVPVLGLVVTNVPHPLVKLFGLLVITGSLLVAAVGVAGIVQIVAERIEGGSELSSYASTLKAAGLVAGAAQLPLIGWIVAAPLLLLAGLGAGFPAVLNLRARRSPTLASSVVEEVR